MPRHIAPTRIALARGRAGFTLVEVLVAMGIFLLAIVPIASLFHTGARTQRNSLDELRANEVAQNARAMLLTRGLDLDELHHAYVGDGRSGTDRPDHNDEFGDSDSPYVMGELYLSDDDKEFVSYFMQRNFIGLMPYTSYPGPRPLNHAHPFLSTMGWSDDEFIRADGSTTNQFTNTSLIPVSERDRYGLIYMYNHAASNGATGYVSGWPLEDRTFPLSNPNPETRRYRFDIFVRRTASQYPLDFADDDRDVDEPRLTDYDMSDHYIDPTETTNEPNPKDWEVAVFVLNQLHGNLSIRMVEKLEAWGGGTGDPKDTFVVEAGNAEFNGSPVTHHLLQRGDLVVDEFGRNYTVVEADTDRVRVDGEISRVGMQTSAGLDAAFPRYIIHGQREANSTDLEEAAGENPLLKMITVQGVVRSYD